MPRPPCGVAVGVVPRSSRESCVGVGRAGCGRARRAGPPAVRSGPETPRAATTSPRGPWTGYGDTGQPDLELVAGDRPAALAGADAVAAQLLRLDQGVVGEPLQPALGRRQRAPGVEHLAERRGVGRHVDLGPVAGAEQVAGVDLGDLHDLLAAGDREVHGLAGLLADRAPWPGGRAGPAPPTGRAARRTARTGCPRRRSPRRHAPAARPVRGPRASATSSTSRGRWPPGDRRR